VKYDKNNIGKMVKIKKYILPEHFPFKTARSASAILMDNEYVIFNKSSK